MSLYGQKVIAVIDTQSEFGVTVRTLKDNVDTLTGQMSTLLADAPETLDTLNEIAAAISDDPAFFTTMASANTTLQTNIDALSTAAATARTALQTALQTAIDANALTSTNAEAALGVRLTSLELDPVTKTYVDSAVTNLIDAAPGVLNTLNEIAAAIGDDENFATTITNNIATVQADVDANETATNTALGLKFDKTGGTLTGSLAIAKSFPDVQLKAGNEKRILFSDAGGGATAAIKHVSTTLDFFAGGIAGSNKEMSIGTDGVDVSALKIDGTAVTATAAEINAFDGRLDTLEADPTTATALAAVQADVDQNETDADAAIAAVQADVDQNETDADNAIALANVAMLAAVATVQADVDANESDADTAIALKYDKTGGTVTGNVVVAKNFPDLQLRSGDEKRLLFTDAGGGATAAIKHVGTSLDFYAGGIGGSNKVLTLEDDNITCDQDVTLNDARVYFNAGSQLIRLKDNQASALKIENGDGSTLDFLDFKTTNSAELLTFGAPNLFNGTVSIAGLTDAANDSAAATAGVAVNQLYRNGSVVMVRVS